jgi:hypothetical protein
VQEQRKRVPGEADLQLPPALPVAARVVEPVETNHDEGAVVVGRVVLEGVVEVVEEVCGSGCSTARERTV